MIGAEIRLHNISKLWGEQTVLKDISLLIRPGSFTALLGPSGCGKTTLLRIIAGLDQPNKGIIEVNGVNVSALDTTKRNLSFVFQNYALFPHLTVGENILFGLKTRRVKVAEQRARLAEVNRLLGITGLDARKPSQLSGGQQQRVALARAIISGRPICLMDEPLSNLDATLRQSMRIELRELQRQVGFTMVYVTHDQVEAMTMADEVALMHQGEIEQFATPNQLYDNPHTTTVATFIGTPAMNVLPVQSIKHVLGFAGPWPANIHHVGIRPESIEIAERGLTHIIVSSSEFLGSESLITAQLGDHTIRIKSHQRQLPSQGTTISVAWTVDAMHFFDARGHVTFDPPFASKLAEHCIAQRQLGTEFRAQPSTNSSKGSLHAS